MKLFESSSATHKIGRRNFLGGLAAFGTAAMVGLKPMDSAAASINGSRPIAPVLHFGKYTLLYHLGTKWIDPTALAEGDVSLFQVRVHVKGFGQADLQSFAAKFPIESGGEVNWTNFVAWTNSPACAQEAKFTMPVHAIEGLRFEVTGGFGKAPWGAACQLLADRSKAPKLREGIYLLAAGQATQSLLEVVPSFDNSISPISAGYLLLQVERA